MHAVPGLLKNQERWDALMNTPVRLGETFLRKAIASVTIFGALSTGACAQETGTDNQKRLPTSIARAVDVYFGDQDATTPVLLAPTQYVYYYEDSKCVPLKIGLYSRSLIQQALEQLRNTDRLGTVQEVCPGERPVVDRMFASGAQPRATVWQVELSSTVVRSPVTFPSKTPSITYSSLGCEISAWQNRGLVTFVRVVARDGFEPRRRIIECLTRAALLTNGVSRAGDTAFEVLSSGYPMSGRIRNTRPGSGCNFLIEDAEALRCVIIEVEKQNLAGRRVSKEVFIDSILLEPAVIKDCAQRQQNYSNGLAAIQGKENKPTEAPTIITR